jgi:hypothetical protein
VRRFNRAISGLWINGYRTNTFDGRLALLETNLSTSITESTPPPPTKLWFSKKFNIEYSYLAKLE